MEIHQLKTFVAVAREGTITRASEVLHLSQPAVSAHIKTIEDALGLSLFSRTPKGMSLTPDGERLLAKAEHTIAAHQALLDEASRTTGRVAGKLRLGAGTSTSHEAVGKLLTELAARHPEVEVVLEHRTSSEILAGLRHGALDAAFYNEGGEPDGELTVTRVGEITIDVVAPRGSVGDPSRVPWAELAEMPWVFPSRSTCCGRSAERLFEARGFRPRRVISVDRVETTRALVAGGIGVGLLHADTSAAAIERGEVERVVSLAPPVQVLFARLAQRASDPVIAAAAAILAPRRPSTRRA
jgi:DNA-binding transcriptional LysR family regulator